MTKYPWYFILWLMILAGIVVGGFTYLAMVQS